MDILIVLVGIVVLIIAAPILWFGWPAIFGLYMWTEVLSETSGGLGAILFVGGLIGNIFWFPVAARHAKNLEDKLFKKNWL